MDVVITYVDGNDPEWQSEYIKYSQQPVDQVRFNSRDNLKFCLRSIALNAPFVRKVHLIVSGPSQVPNWINRTEVDIVYHKDIIPEEYLPTFNSRTIEMCMHNIKDLDEEFVYFNDDMFLVKRLSKEDFFKNGKVSNVISIYDDSSLKKLTSHPVYLEPHKRCTSALHSLVEIPNGLYFITNHGPVPFLKSIVQKVYNELESDIKPTLTRFRTERDYIHFMYYTYQYLSGMVDLGNTFKTKFFNSYSDLSQVYRTLTMLSTSVKSLCFNDCNDRRGDKYTKLLHKQISDYLGGMFPNTCKYEVMPKVSLCVIVRNENKYLLEYINHYIKLGFHKIYLYDNNTADEENPLDVIQPFIDSGNLVYINFRNKKVCQKEAYNHCLQYYKHDNDWIAFFDADEFLELPTCSKISDFVSQSIFRKYDCIKINWLCYGDNEQVYYEDKPIQERFSKPAIYNPILGIKFNYHVHMNYYQKSIVKTSSKAIFLNSVHYPDNALLCNSDGSPSLSINSNTPIYNAILKHYITKSTEEYCMKVFRGYPDQIVTEVQKDALLDKYFTMNVYSDEKQNLINNYKYGYKNSL